MRRKRARSEQEEDAEYIAYQDALLKGIAASHADEPNLIRGWPLWPETPGDLIENAEEELPAHKYWMRGVQAVHEAINFKEPPKTKAERYQGEMAFRRNLISQRKVPPDFFQKVPVTTIAPREPRITFLKPKIFSSRQRETPPELCAPSEKKTPNPGVSVKTKIHDIGMKHRLQAIGTGAVYCDNCKQTLQWRVSYTGTSAQEGRAMFWHCSICGFAFSSHRGVAEHILRTSCKERVGVSSARIEADLRKIGASDETHKPQRGRIVLTLKRPLVGQQGRNNSAQNVRPAERQPQKAVRPSFVEPSVSTGSKTASSNPGIKFTPYTG